MLITSQSPARYRGHRNRPGDAGAEPHAGGKAQPDIEGIETVVRTHVHVNDCGRNARPDTEVIETAVIAVSCAASTAMRRPLQRDQRMAGSIQQPGAGRAAGAGVLAVQVVVRAGRSPDAGWRLRRWRAGLSRLS